MVQRGGSIGFENVPVDGSEKMADDLMESIEPFDSVSYTHLDVYKRQLFWERGQRRRAQKHCKRSAMPCS